MKAKHILKDIKGKTITEAINNLKEIESLGFGNEKINVKVNASVRGFTISSDIKIFIEIKEKIMVILDYRDNPVKINIEDEKIRFNKIELLKNFIDSYICTCNGVLDNEPYEKIIEWLDGDAFVTSFENALGFDSGDVLKFAKEYYKNYKVQ